MTKELKLSPSYLLIGSELYIENIVKNFIKNVFCADATISSSLGNIFTSAAAGGSCNLCIDCKKVDLKMHHNIIWLKPEAHYTLSDLEPIFKSAIFALEDTKHFFFVISKAQQLSQFCANSLLKLMEEPPRGYHVILTAQTKERILPTILSRCIIQNYTTESSSDSVFFNYFNGLNEPDFLEFSQAIQGAKIPESELMILIDQIYFFWMEKLKILIQENNVDQAILIQLILDLMNKARAETIMPGSGKIFLRNLYIQFIMLLQND